MTSLDIQIENGEYTRIHNTILEMLSKTRLSGQELRAILFLLRKTYGWNKKEDAISLSQWREGMGLKQNSQVIEILNKLVEKKIIYKAGKKGLVHIYGFNKHYEQWASSTLQGTTLQGTTLQLTRGSTLQLTRGSTPQVTNKRQLKTIKDREEEKHKKTPKTRDENLSHPAVITYREICHLTPNPIQRKALAETIVNIELWKSVLTDWMLSGWKPGNIAGQIERYKNNNTDRYKPPGDSPGYTTPEYWGS